MVCSVRENEFATKEMMVLIPIARWLMQSKIWPLVCFVSSVVGLISYALSSSFNHLLGKWSWWKLSLYTVFSFIISFTVLFTKKRHSSTTLRLEAHLAFLVLIITSVYSFFLDKLFKGKSDAYGLVSFAAFAIMSLCLSRQIHLGFEVDLLYFFCGALLVQLMKVKLWLVTIGAIFSYSLVILRTSLNSPPLSGHLVGSSLDAVQVQGDHLAIDVHSDSQDISDGRAIQVDSFQAINIGTAQEANTDSAFVSPVSQGNFDSSLVMLEFLNCINAFKKENLKLIHMVCMHADQCFEGEHDSRMMPPVQLDVNLVMDSLSLRIINNFRENVKLMVGAGFEEECCRVYSHLRQEFLTECLSRLGLQELINMVDVDIKMLKVESWIKYCKVALKILFPNERRLCDRVFEGFSSAADVSFMQICRYFTTPILSFANTVANGSHSPYDSFRVTGKVFETWNSLRPDFESLFHDQYNVSLRNEANMVWKKLREANAGIFMQLENLIYHDMQQVTVPHGFLHPVTRQVMNCLSDVPVFKEISHQIFAENTIVPSTEENSPSIRDRLAQIVELLESNLAAISKDYTNPSLFCFFMMNNLRFIQLRVEIHPMRRILGKDWGEKYTGKIQRSLQLYQRSSWDKVLYFLNLDNIESEEPNVIAESMKDKLNLFYHHFDEICSVQSKWYVIDNHLKEQILIFLGNILLPIYGKFIDRFQNVLGKQAYDYIKYGMLQIQDHLDHLFVVN
ncbi:exocyst complex component EXO70B1-like [Abrus precatorius]|uniref:Exocyst subunit Exo70 family protein n=1 Tax=Abrus precatorius TaxID=3816 RepID=A0A8B8JQ03_ABRPR|nr:exocyst complex component EXO70B1-like [Abrus precatorius]